MLSRQLQNELADEVLHATATVLSARLRNQKCAAERKKTLYDINALIQARRILSEHRDWHEERER